MRTSWRSFFETAVFFVATFFCKKCCFLILDIF
nr:MAG TPA: hypothetical protein [Caudoviricetes sp.]